MLIFCHVSNTESILAVYLCKVSFTVPSVCHNFISFSQDRFFRSQQRSSAFCALCREPTTHHLMITYSAACAHTFPLNPLYFLIGPVRAPHVSRRVESSGHFYVWSRSRGSGDSESSQGQKSCLSLLVISRETIFMAPVLLRICTDPLVLKFMLDT